MAFWPFFFKDLGSRLPFFKWLGFHLSFLKGLGSYLSFFKVLRSWLPQSEPEREWDVQPTYDTVEEQVSEDEADFFCKGLTSYHFLEPKPKSEVGWLVEANLRKGEMEFWSLRMQVFAVDPRSATPIARLIYRQLGKQEVYDLMDGFDERAEQKMVSISMDDDWHWKWEKVRAMERMKGWAPNPRLRSLIDEAREEYAELLRDIEHRDVDVLYTGEDGRTEIYVNDYDRIMKAGGRLYARFATKWEARTIGMSVVLPLQAFEEIFPIGRKNVTIRVNTPPAEPKKPSSPKQWYGVDSISKSMHPKYAALGSDSSQEELQQASNEVLDETCDDIEADPKFQEFVKADKARRDVAKAKARPWYSGFRAYMLKNPEWISETNPLSQDLAFDNNEWWQADLELKRQIIEEWHEQGDKNHASYPALCKTLIPEINLADRNDVVSNYTSEKYHTQFELCKKLERPYQDAEKLCLKEPWNFQTRAQFTRIAQEVKKQQDSLDFWKEHVCGESNNPVQLAVTGPLEGSGASHDDGAAVIVGSKPIDVPILARKKGYARIDELSLESDAGAAGVDPPEPNVPHPAKGKKLERIEELESENGAGEAVVKPPEAKGPRRDKGKAKLNAQWRLAELGR